MSEPSDDGLENENETVLVEEPVELAPRTVRVTLPADGAAISEPPFEQTKSENETPSKE